MNYYAILDEMKSVLESVGFVTVTYGDFDKLDLNRQSIYPLAHVMAESSGIGQQPYSYSFSIIALDLVIDTKEDLSEQTEPFYGVDNLQDIHSDIHHKLANAVELFRRGASYADGYQLESPPEITPLEEVYENRLAGWLMPLTIIAKNYSDVC